MRFEPKHERICRLSSKVPVSKRFCAVSANENVSSARLSHVSIILDGIEFEERAGKVKSAKGAKTDLVLDSIKHFTGNFTLANLEKTCPGVSRDMIRLVLKDLSKKGIVKCLGKGPGALWAKEGNTLK